jgi:3-phenylpropionate/cinnamic acid dioxygenase small subunit
VTAATEVREALTLIDELQLRYIDALDEKDMGAWLALFSPDASASYTFTTAESVESNFPVAIMLDDCRGRLEDRVTFISKIWAGTFQDYRMRHSVQRIRCEQDAGMWRVRSNFRVICTPIGRDQRVETISGVYQDVIDVSGAQPLYRSKKAIADLSVLPRYLVYPI